MNDPAVLFYTSDFLTGVIDMTMEERGQYITLLSYQHQKGHISTETIRLLVGNVSDKVLQHFKIDKDGLYFNGRMDKEKEARRKFTESRRQNGKKGGRPKKPSGYSYGKPNENHMGNENEDENINENKIIDLYINNINSNISSIEFEKLNQYIEIFKNDLRVIKYAIEYCKMYKAYNINYLCKILNNWEKSGYKTLEQVKEHEKERANESNKHRHLPSEHSDILDYDWLNDNGDDDV